jgi:hypothetical protein
VAEYQRGQQGGSDQQLHGAGNGSNTIFVDPEHDLVIVWRWHAGGDFFARVVASIKSQGSPTSGKAPAAGPQLFR